MTSPISVAQVEAWLRGNVPSIARLRLDSRRIDPHDVFVACAGAHTDGRDHVDAAVARGAIAVLSHAPLDTEPLVPSLVVPGLQDMLGELAHRWYDRPSEALTVVAVTGTNGKTSCVQWLSAAMTAGGLPCGALGTLGVTGPDGTTLPDSGLTTPDVLSLHDALARLRAAGAQAVALEASSIGLVQGRLDGVRLDVAAFTNLTHDHLDFHTDMADYAAAKRRLFDAPGLRRAVLYVDDPTARRWWQEGLPVPVTACAMSPQSEPPADVRAEDVHPAARGQVFTLAVRDGAAQLSTPALGLHNVANLLVVAGVLQALGWDLHRMAGALGGLPPAPGRLQVVGPLSPVGQPGPLAVVDYAHTPDALEHALRALRPVAAQRGGALRVVFGCGGGRDAAKRPLMGGVAARLADGVVLTSDNPRRESPQAILAQIEAGMGDTPRRVEVDRALAILTTLWQADARDVVLIAGKGHETIQELADGSQPFDDRQWAGLALALRDGPSLTIDSRQVQPGQWFVALRGERFDGHDFVPQVAAAGAGGAVVARNLPQAALPQVVVGHTLASLQCLASAWRAGQTLPVIGVTGSNGKTTTKEMLAAVLRGWQGSEAVLATAGNLNNDIGVPLMVSRLRAGHRVAVFEMGMNHPGEIAVLAGMARPTVALVNNAQREHQEFMHSVEAVARENGSVLSALPSDGVAVFPGDEPYTDLWRTLAGDRRILTFGLSPDCDVQARHIAAEPRRTVCELVTPQGRTRLQLSAPGVHNLRNALATVACALAVGAPLDTVVEALARFQPVSGRLQSSPLPGGGLVVDDTYNANPDSVRAAIDVLATLEGPRVLVLGDMAEVGEHGPAMHYEVGEYARQRGIDRLLTLGTACREAVRAFGGQAQAFEDIGALQQALSACLPAQVLVKGSRSMRMERVVQWLQAGPDGRVDGAQPSSTPGAAHVA